MLSKNIFLTLYFLLNLCFSFFSCSSSVPKTGLIIFDDSYYQPTNPSSIHIYHSRLELPNKYKELGSIKFEGEVDLNKIIDLTASKGADALLLDGNNYILIKFIEVKGQKDEKDI